VILLGPLVLLLLGISFLVFAYLMLNKAPDEFFRLLSSLSVIIPDCEDSKRFLRGYAVLISLMALIALLAKIVLRG